MRMVVSAAEWDRALVEAVKIGRAREGVSTATHLGTAIMALRFGIEAMGMTAPVGEAEIVDAEIVDEGTPPLTPSSHDPAVVDPRSTARSGGTDGADGFCDPCGLTYPQAQLGMPGRLCPTCGSSTAAMVEIAEGRFAPAGSPEAGSPGDCRAPVGGAQCALPANHDGRHGRASTVVAP